MKMRNVRCSFCGTNFDVVAWASSPYSCGNAECEKEMVEAEREREDQARDAAQEGNYERYL